MKLTYRNPHVKDTHVKHAAAVSIVSGTLLEAAHILYPSGLVMLGFAAIIAVYEPHIVHVIKGDFHADGE